MFGIAIASGGTLEGRGSGDHNLTSRCGHNTAAAATRSARTPTAQPSLLNLIHLRRASRRTRRPTSIRRTTIAARIARELRPTCNHSRSHRSSYTTNQRTSNVNSTKRDDPLAILRSEGLPRTKERCLVEPTVGRMLPPRQSAPPSPMRSTPAVYFARPLYPDDSI
jgi:hypothetical protein